MLAPVEKKKCSSKASLQVQGNCVCTRWEEYLLMRGFADNLVEVNTVCIGFFCAENLYVCRESRVVYV